MASVPLPPAELRAAARWGPWWTGLTALLFLGVAAVYAYCLIFSRKMADDEGYLMITLQGFLAGHPLYDEVFTQYGPFYYFYQWLARTVTSLPLTHDATRLFCIFHWLLAAVVLGVACGRLTRSILGGLFGFMQAVIHLSGIANEPGHPQELVAVLLAMGVLVSTAQGSAAAVLGALAVLGAMLGLIKINVGLFFGFALFLAMRFQAEDRFNRRGWAWCWAVLSMVMPLVLMRRHLEEPWCRNYATVAALTLLAVVPAAHSRSVKGGLRLRVWVIAAAGGLVPVALLLGWTLALGSSVSGLFEGLVATPLRLPNVALLPKPCGNAAAYSAVASLCVAVLLGLGKFGPRATGIVAAAKGVFGLLGAVGLVHEANAQLDYLLPWLWLVAMPTGEAPGTPNGAGSFPRGFLSLAAAWQGLQAYPISGTQVHLATLLLVPVFTLCLTDALRTASLTPPLEAARARLRVYPAGLWRALVVAAGLCLFADGWCQVHHWRRYYAGLEPLGLPGSSRVRLPPDQVALYRPLMQYLVDHCDTFITYPGYNSFYFWTGKPPPTQLNSTGWGLLTQAQQAQILRAWRRARQPRLVVHEYALRAWGDPPPPPIAPLVRAVREECQEVQRIGPFVVYQLKRGT